MKNVFLKSVGIVTLLTIASKLLGFVREAFIANYFGTSVEADAYFIASLIPMMIFTVIGSAISTGIIPLYVSQKKQDEERANKIIGIVATVFTILSLLISILCWFFAKNITLLMAPGFTLEQIELTALLIRIMIFASLFFVLSAFATGVLHANKKFVAPAAVTIANNLIIIVALITLADKYGIIGLAFGTMLGISSQFFIQYPQFKAYNIRPSIEIIKYKADVKNYLFVIMPIVISSVFSQINKVVDRIIASDLQTGSISALNYSNKLLYLPLSIIIMAFVTVLYPYLIDALEESIEKFMELALKGISIIIYISIPILVVMLISKQELVALAFGRGEFTKDAEVMTTIGFFYYSLGMIFIAMKTFLFHCLYALKRVNITIFTSLVFILMNIGLSIWLSNYLAHGGIALATSIAMLLHTFTLLIILFSINKVTDSSRTFIFASLKMSLLFFLVFLLSYFSMRGLALNLHILKILVNTVITFSIFILFSFVLKIKEMASVLELIKSKTHKKRAAD
ncbi:murein biosynthesis integral membrane protein MurJ [Bacillaceae bacterium IKA-2]|nr:murein biosynthesis integral membrane protein MurJ [Bacillaceae bacterium IKA-2]